MKAVGCAAITLQKVWVLLLSVPLLIYLITVKQSIWHTHRAGLAQSVVQCVELDVLRDVASRVRSSSEPPVERIFPLELTWAPDSIPPNSFG